LEEIKKRLRGKVMLFIDGAPQHRAKKVRKYLEENKDYLSIFYLPKGSPQFNAVEECWRQGKYYLLESKYYPSCIDLKSTSAKYYRTRRFNLNMVKYLLRDN
jgi:transposase